jgi:hypothetical protein
MKPVNCTAAMTQHGPAARWLGLWMLLLLCFAPGMASGQEQAEGIARPIVWWIQDVLSQGLSQAVVSPMIQELSGATGAPVRAIGNQAFDELMAHCHDDDAPDIIMGTQYVLDALRKICPYRLLAITRHDMAVWVLKSSTAKRLQDLEYAAANKTGVSVTQHELTALAPSLRLVPFPNYRQAVVAFLAGKTEALVAFPGVIHVMSDAVRTQLRLLYRLKTRPQVWLLIRSDMPGKIREPLKAWLVDKDSEAYRIITETLAFSPWDLIDDKSEANVR